MCSAVRASSQVQHNTWYIQYKRWSWLDIEIFVCASVLLLTEYFNVFTVELSEEESRQIAAVLARDAQVRMYEQLRIRYVLFLYLFSYYYFIYCKVQWWYYRVYKVTTILYRVYRYITTTKKT